MFVVFSLGYSAWRAWKCQVSNKRAKLAAGCSILHWRVQPALHFWKERTTINLHFWHVYCSSSPFHHRHPLYNSTQGSSSVSFIKSRRCPTSFPPLPTLAALTECKYNGMDERPWLLPGAAICPCSPYMCSTYIHAGHGYVLDACRALYHFFCVFKNHF